MEDYKMPAPPSKKVAGSGNIVPPVLRDVGKLAAGVAAVSTASGSATGNPRNKCALAPGHSLMDWIRLGQSGRDLTGLGRRAGTLSVSPKQLAQHSTSDDAWLAIRGKVYNVTHYMEFHPGGRDELMKGVGKDATDMFNEVHAWVNYESILGKCLVGRLCSLEPDVDTSALFFGPLASTPSPVGSSGKNMATATDLTNGGVVKDVQNLKFDWIQKTDYITTIFYTKAYCNPQIQITSPTKENSLTISIFHSKYVFINELQFLHDIHWPCRVYTNQETGKVEIKFRKILGKIWDNYGTLNQSCNPEPSPEVAANERIKYVVMHRVQVNHNSWLISLQRVDGVKQTVPIGWHVRVHGSINGQPIARSYTPISSSILLSFLSKSPPLILTNSNTSTTSNPRENTNTSTPLPTSSPETSASVPSNSSPRTSASAPLNSSPKTSISVPPTSPPETSTSVPPTISPRTSASAPPNSSPKNSTSAPPTILPRISNSDAPISSPRTSTSAPSKDSPETCTSVPPISCTKTSTSDPPTSSPRTSTSVPPTNSPRISTSAPVTSSLSTSTSDPPIISPIPRISVSFREQCAPAPCGASKCAPSVIGYRPPAPAPEPAPIITSTANSISTNAISKPVTEAMETTEATEATEVIQTTEATEVTEATGAIETYIGDVILLVKSYPEGMLSPWLTSKSKGDVIEVSAPIGTFTLDLFQEAEMAIVLAAGTGLTPMVKLVEWLLVRRQNKCQKITLMFFNRHEEDILCKDYLENLKKEDSRFSVEYILSDPHPEWTGRTGHVNSDMIEEILHVMITGSNLLPGEVFAAICGPTVFTNVVRTLLTELGFPLTRVYPFQG